MKQIQITITVEDDINYLATNANGEIFAFIDKPEISISCNEWNTGGLQYFIGYTETPEDFTKTLIKLDN